MFRLHTSTYYKVLLCVVALNYCAFRTEIFDDENRDNHPVVPAGVTFSASSLNWETFDKNNAPEAFAFDAHVAIEPLFQSTLLPPSINIPYERQELVRDKSPPPSAFPS
jgi:hypothetical protein